MADHKGGTYTNTYFESTWELKDMHKINYGFFQGQFKSAKEENTDTDYHQV
jgi:hypothetical protein